MSDFNVAVRSLIKTPGFSIVAILTIATGIGANTALFSVYDRLVLNPVTIPDSSSLVAIWANNPQLNFNAPAVAWPRYEVIRRDARVPKAGRRRANGHRSPLEYRCFLRYRRCFIEFA